MGHGAIGEVVEGLVKRGVRAASEGVSKAVADFHHGTAEGLKKVAAETRAADDRVAQSLKDLEHADRHGAPRPGGARPARDLSRVDRGDGRDPRGHFTGKGGYGKSGEAKGLANYESLNKRPVIKQQIGVTMKDGGTRFYDGLALKEDGTYEGIEVKSGSASQNAHQREFDDRVDSGTSATGMLNGKSITVTSTYLMRVRE